MKKVLVALVVLTMVCLGSVAFAAVDVSVGGSVQIRSRDFSNLRFDNGDPSGTYADTQERVELDVNVKAGDDVRGKIALWNDFQDWGTIEQQQGQGFGDSVSGSQSAAHFGFREAWVNFNMPVIPVNVTAGHQLLALGEGWFLRNKHFGDDAWVIANVTGANTVAFVNIVAEKGSPVSAGTITASSNYFNADSAVDAYALLDVFKIDDNNMVGAYAAYVDARASAQVPYPPISLSPSSTQIPEFLNVAGTQLYNLGLHYEGKISVLSLKAEADGQAGRLAGAFGNPKYSGNQVVIQGTVPVAPVGFEFTLARGSGNSASVSNNDNLNPNITNEPHFNIGQYINFLDIDPHYTFLYEYKTITAAGAQHTGFANTTAISVGANADIVKGLNVALDVWYLLATDKDSTPLALWTNDTQTSMNVGTEVDLTINWKLYDNLTWNWNLGYYKPGGAMRTGASPYTAPNGAGQVSSTANNYLVGAVGNALDPVMGIQGVLSLNF